MVDNSKLLKDGEKYYINKVNMVIKIDKDLYKIELDNMMLDINLTGDIVQCRIIEDKYYIYNFPLIAFNNGSQIKVLEKVEK